ncbi:hypothetical protein L1987_07676 [Smallanthus sonchifolius]|uniref:Uncharacterized protein n=1 Tax=Smallanthus sonchifolius TaxID=185202 RepID=A0ACB9K0W1_9ASTR|nr:hypothetical protein L1987_07676 [Smallanthus sonchifolius]
MGILLLNLMILILIQSRTIAAQSQPGCPDKCGNVTIPYPFGTIEGCYLSKFYKVNCTKLQIWNTSFKLLDISLDGYMHGLLPMAYRCYRKDKKIFSMETRVKLSRFPISGSLNVLTTVGCDARADMKIINGEDYITGCLSMTGCNKLTNGLCFGMGCSQVPVPYMLISFRIHTERNTNSSVGKWSFNNCTYGFVVEKGHYTFQETDFDNMHNRSFPVRFEWSVGNTSCEEAQKNGTSYLCKENSVCSDSEGYQGYHCRCAQGYEGNPYIPHGCQGNAYLVNAINRFTQMTDNFSLRFSDVNECEGSQNDCAHGCANTNGSYKCVCPFGQHGDGKKKGKGKGCTYSDGSIFAGEYYITHSCDTILVIE